MTEDKSKKDRLRTCVRRDILIARVAAFLAIAASVAVSLVLELEDKKTELVISFAIILIGLSLALILILLSEIYAMIERKYK